MAAIETTPADVKPSPALSMRPELSITSFEAQSPIVGVVKH